MRPIEQVELKLDIVGEKSHEIMDAISARRRWAGSEVGQRIRQQIADVYYDTDGGRLRARRGYLRDRTVERSADEMDRRLTYRRTVSGMAAEQAVEEAIWDVGQIGNVLAQLREDFPELPAPDGNAPTIEKRLSSMGLSPVLRVNVQREIMRLNFGRDSVVSFKLDRYEYPEISERFAQIEVDFSSSQVAPAAARAYAELRDATGSAGLPGLSGKLERGLLLKWLRDQKGMHTA